MHGEGFFNVRRIEVFSYLGSFFNVICSGIFFRILVWFSIFFFFVAGLVVYVFSDYRHMVLSDIAGKIFLLVFVIAMTQGYLSSGASRAG